MGVPKVTLHSSASSRLVTSSNFDHPELPSDENLIEAVASNDIDRTHKLLEQGADINCTDSSWKRRGTPLLLACQNGNLPMVKLFIDEYGADIHKIPYVNDGISSSDESSSDESDCEEFDDFASVNSPLHYAASNLDKGLIEFLLSHGSDVNEHTKTCGDTALLIASYFHSRPIVELLLQHGADPNQGENLGKTPLHALASSDDFEEDHCDMIKLLIDNGADVNKVDNVGKTPLFLACEIGNHKLVALLLQHDTNVEATDMFGQTALFSCCEYDDIVELLLNHGANVNHCDDEGNNAVSVARREGHVESLRSLLIASRLKRS